MQLYKYGKKLNQLTPENLRELGVPNSLYRLMVLGKNGMIGFVYDQGTIQGEESCIIRWMHGGRSEWFRHLLDLDVLTPNEKQSPEPELVYRTHDAINWHSTARDILRAGKITEIRIVPSDSREPSECMAYLGAIRSHNDAIQIKFDNGCEIVIYDATDSSCCEKRFIETTDDLQSFVGESFVKLDIIDVAEPAPRPEDDCTEQTFVKLQTNRDSATFNIYNVQNGCYASLDAAVCVYVPHPTLDRPNTPFLRSPEKHEHHELAYNLNTQLRLLGIDREQIGDKD